MGYLYIWSTLRMVCWQTRSRRCCRFWDGD